MKAIISVVVGQATNYGFLDVAGRLTSNLSSGYQLLSAVKSLKRFLDSF